MASQRFPKEFKEAIVKKLLHRGSQTIPEFCEANNVAVSTVSRWQSECANTLEMKSKKNKSKYSSENILKIVSETHLLNETDLGLYLRKHGLHGNQIAEWKSSFLGSVNLPRINLNKKDDRDIKIISLEKDLKKKNAALAEATALLILQKKIDLIWPMEKLAGEL